MRRCLLLHIGLAAACTQTGQFDEAAFSASLYGASLCGTCLGLFLLFLAAMPLCGLLESYAKVISCLTILLGLTTLAVPFLGSLNACLPFAETVCQDRCSGYECDAAEKEQIGKICQGLAFLVVYIGAYGWVSCLLGLVASVMGCCVCCQCCRPRQDLKKDMTDLAQAKAAKGEVSADMKITVVPNPPMVVVGTPKQIPAPN
ncbi:unnamed protein product [Effrenium voratum]|uniref:Transmembrane protein n=1 Tax=Effrenium voratum TaxID=2562239 RepID=A0AA36MJV5_9DINO|nr:unnamed protein product [Effrenium voratum]CAJ1436837.1 unnamed protein product [Effrenium voratum]